MAPCRCARQDIAMFSFQGICMEDICILLVGSDICIVSSQGISIEDICILLVGIYRRKHSWGNAWLLRHKWATVWRHKWAPYLKSQYWTQGLVFSLTTKTSVVLLLLSWARQHGHKCKPLFLQVDIHCLKRWLFVIWLTHGKKKSQTWAALGLRENCVIA